MLPWLPAGRVVRIDGRGELLRARPRALEIATAPTVLLLHGWTASSDLQFFTAYEALAERYSFVGIDHRGHGRGLRSPTPFQLEDAADDAAAVIRELGIAPVVAVGYSMGGPISLHLARRHRDARPRAGRAGDRARVDDDVAGAGALAGAARVRVVAAQPGLPLVPEQGGAEARSAPATRWSPTCRGSSARWPATIRSRWSTPAAPSPPTTPGRGSSTLGVPAGSLITTRDRLVGPGKQRALAAALGATVRELRSDHFAALADPAPFAALTVELVDEVVSAAQRTSTADVPPSPDAA